MHTHRLHSGNQLLLPVLNNRLPSSIYVMLTKSGSNKRTHTHVCLAGALHRLFGFGAFCGARSQFCVCVYHFASSTWYSFHLIVDCSRWAMCCVEVSSSYIYAVPFKLFLHNFALWLVVGRTASVSVGAHFCLLCCWIPPHLLVAFCPGMVCSGRKEKHQFSSSCVFVVKSVMLLVCGRLLCSVAQRIFSV